LDLGADRDQSLRELCDAQLPSGNIYSIRRMIEFALLRQLCLDKSAHATPDPKRVTQAATP
jgi:hypothetical protein